HEPLAVRERLCALHVLRDLRRGVSVRRALLEPRVRLRGVRHPRADPREGAAGGMDVHRAPAAGARRGRGRAERGRVVNAHEYAFVAVATIGSIAAVAVVTARNVVHAALYLVVTLAAVG